MLPTKEQAYQGFECPAGVSSPPNLMFNEPFNNPVLAVGQVPCGLLNGSTCNATYYGDRSKASNHFANPLTVSQVYRG